MLLGMGQVAHGPYKPGTWPYNPHIRDFDYNPERARTLLAEAGWRKRNGDGILVKDGKPFQFTILTNQGNDQRIRTAVIIQRRLKLIGIDMKIRVIEWASFITNFIDKRNFEAVILGWTIGQDPDLFDIWHSSKTGPKELNFIGYKNTEVDVCWKKGEAPFDMEKRQTLLLSDCRKFLPKISHTPFSTCRMRFPVVSARFRGIEPAPAGIMYNFIKWYVPKEEQMY